MTPTDVRHPNVQINKDKSLKKSRKKNDLDGHSSFAERCSPFFIKANIARVAHQGSIAESWLTWFPYDCPAQSHVHSARG